jgi:hypothetical protein
LSIDWLQLTLTESPVVPMTVKFPGTVGAVVSAGGAHAAVDAFSVALPERLPAASTESTASA